MSTTAQRIKDGMAIRGMKQADLAEKTGISKGALSSYLSGRYVPKQNNTYLIAKALNVDEGWLMGADVPMERKNEPSGLEPQLKHTGVRIPVYGRVAAGIPIEMITDIVDQEEITEEMARRGTYFGLTIHGDSMEPRIWDGDIVIVRSQDDAESGELVIATVNGSDATCKRLKKYEGGIWLMSMNTKYEPMNYTDEEIEKKPVKILGKVVEVRGKLE